MELPDNPLAVLTFLSAPAVLTNAACVLLFGTGNRYGRAIDRVHQLAHILSDSALPVQQQRLRFDQLHATERRAALIVRALTCFYTAVACFIASTLICLLGVVLRQLAFKSGFNAFLLSALAAGVVGMCSIMAGALMLAREAWSALYSLQQERAFLASTLAGS